MNHQTNQKELRQPSEEVQQQQIFAWAATQEFAHPELLNLFAVPNGGKRVKSEAARMKAGGVRAGVPDMMLAVPRTVRLDIDGQIREGDANGLFIELKKDVKARLEPEQKEWLYRLNNQGYICVRADGFEEGVTAICSYLGIPRPITMEGDKSRSLAEMLNETLMESALWMATGRAAWMKKNGITLPDPGKGVRR